MGTNPNLATRADLSVFTDPLWDPPTQTGLTPLPSDPMRIGAYIDGFNLYYGGRGICGRPTSGWRWLNIRALLANHAPWPTPTMLSVTYCTARVSGASNPVGQREQDVYLRALTRSGSVDRMSFGNYVVRIATAPLATAGRNGKPVIAHPWWPIMVQDGAERDAPVTLIRARVDTGGTNSPTLTDGHINSLLAWVTA